MNNNANPVTGHEDCTGCAVCLLSCPVWKQTHDIMMTNCGRARALQAGAAPEELKESAYACLLCGACTPVCPSGVDTVALTTSLRAANARKTAKKPASAPALNCGGKKVLLPGPALRENKSLFNKLSVILGGDGLTIPPCDELSDIAAGLDAGELPEPGVLEEAVKTMRGAAGFIAAEGYLHKYLRRWFPAVPVRGLGEELLGRASSGLKAGDLYIIDPRAFNADQTRLVKFYDEIRLESGCTMSTSLQRAAMPAGPARGVKSAFDCEAQARWILGRGKASRVIVESAEDLEVFGRVAQVPVIHVTELE